MGDFLLFDLNVRKTNPFRKFGSPTTSTPVADASLCPVCLGCTPSRDPLGALPVRRGKQDINIVCSVALKVSHSEGPP